MIFDNDGVVTPTNRNQNARILMKSTVMENFSYLSVRFTTIIILDAEYKNRIVFANIDIEKI